MAESSENVSTTTLQDIPLEVLDYILMKSVVKTVRGGKLAKCIWRREAYRLIKRLKTVWSQWYHRLTKKWFWVVLGRTLDSLGPVQIYGKILVRQPVEDVRAVMGVTTMKNDIFLLSYVDGYMYPSLSSIIGVYDRNDLETMKNIIPLNLGNLLDDVVACDLSSCLYILQRKYVECDFLIYEVKKDGEKYGRPTEWKFFEGRYADIRASVDGELVLATGFGADGRIEVYKSDGSLRYNIPLPESVIDLCRSPFQKSNGNFVLFSGTSCEDGILVEIEKNGNIVQEVVFDENLSCFDHRLTMDVHGRLIVSTYDEDGYRLFLFNAEYNQLEIAPLDWWKTVYSMHYNKERDELLFVDDKILTIVSFAEDTTV